MAKTGKKYLAASSKVADRPHDLKEALSVVKDVAFAKFDETVEIHIRLGEKIKEAEAAGADLVGGDDLVEKIAGGFIDFDALVATPDMMKGVGRLGKVLGPKGLMPNPKTGTVTFDVAKAVKDIKAGKVEYRVDKDGIIHAPVGKLSFGVEKLQENTQALLDAVVKAKPASSKGKYVKTAFIASTMGPSVALSTTNFETK